MSQKTHVIARQKPEAHAGAGAGRAVRRHWEGLRVEARVRACTKDRQPRL